MKNILKYFIIFSSLSVLLVFSVEAQELNGDSETDNIQEQEGAQGIAPRDIDRARAGNGETPLINAREAIKQNAQERQEIIQQGVRDIKELVRERIENRKELLKQKIENAKELIKQTREEVRNRVEERRQEIKTQLKNIRNEHKQGIAERIFDNINDLNMRMTDRFFSIINKIEAVLSRIESRADKAEENGVNVSAVRTAILEAESMISVGRTVVEEQSQIVYSFEVNDEETLRLDVGVARQTLHADLTEVRNSIVAMREAVKEAAMALSQIPRVDQLEVPADTTELDGQEQ